MGTPQPPDLRQRAIPTATPENDSGPCPPVKGRPFGAINPLTAVHFGEKIRHRRRGANPRLAPAVAVPFYRQKRPFHGQWRLIQWHLRNNIDYIHNAKHTRLNCHQRHLKYLNYQHELNPRNLHHPNGETYELYERPRPSK